ncbi:MAG: Calx-beta domain-containing protein [Kineosporiaceae bacterium]
MRERRWIGVAAAVVTAGACFAGASGAGAAGLDRPAVPKVSALQVSRASVDVASADAVQHVRLRVRSNLKRPVQIFLEWGSPLPLAPFGGARLLLDEGDRVSGNEQDGWYEGDVTVPRYAAGRWRLQFVQLLHPDASSTYLLRDTAPVLASGDFTATSAVVDSEAPVVGPLSVTPEVVDVTAGAAEATVTARITDDLSGFARADFTFGLPPDSYRLLATFTAADRISGDAHDGVYRATVAVPWHLRRGQVTWQLDSALVVDAAGNSADQSVDQWPAVITTVDTSPALLAPTPATDLRVTPLDGVLEVRWALPASTGGAPVDRWIVTTSPGGRRTEQPFGSVRIAQVVVPNGVPTRVQVTAVTAGGESTSQWSAPATARPLVTVEGGRSVQEGHDGRALLPFTVRLSAPSRQKVTVTLVAHGGRARAGVDYDATPVTVTVPSGRTTAEVGLPVIGDDLAEGDEQVIVRLTEPRNALVGNVAIGAGTIVDDDR